MEHLIRFLGLMLVTLSWAGAAGAGVGVPLRGTDGIVDPPQWCVDGTVSAVAETRDHIFVAGNLYDVGRPYGGGRPVRLDTGEPDMNFPQVAGAVYAVACDGAGGWFIGGDFSAVNGCSRHHLAHILRGGALSTWTPAVDSTVWSLGISGGVLLVGGDFLSIDGRAREHLGAFDVRSGTLRSLHADVDGSVRAVCAVGRQLFVGGSFAHASGQERLNLAAFDLETSALLPWNPRADAPVWTMATTGETLFVGGLFEHIGRVPRTYVAAIGPTSDAPLAWNARVRWHPKDNYDLGTGVTTLRICDSMLYVAGEFDSIGELPRRSCGRVLCRSGACDTWNPRVESIGGWNAYVTSMAVAGGAVYVCGVFSGLGGVYNAFPANAFAGAVSATTGERNVWNPRPSQVPAILEPGGGCVFIGGDLTTLWDWSPRAGCAAFNKATGAIEAWNPAADGPVLSMLVRGDTIYIGGDFTRFAGQARMNAAAFRESNFDVTSWNPSPNGMVRALQDGSDGLFLGGDFAVVGGLARNALAKVDYEAGTPSAWTTSTDSYALATTLLRVDTTLFVGGLFHHMGGQPRSGIAALNASTGLALPWAASLDGYAYAIATTDSVLVLGGNFFTVNGEPRHNLAKVSLGTGQLSAWRADVDDPAGLSYGQVNSLVVIDSTVYVGGVMSRVNQTTTSAVAAVDLRSGTVRDWACTLDNGAVWTVGRSGGRILLGGDFRRVGKWSTGGMADVAPWADASLGHVPERSGWVTNAPNPANGSTEIRFRVSVKERVALDVLDLQGRRVLRPIEARVYDVGTYQVLLDTHQLRPGVYFYRLSTETGVEARKMLIVH